MPAILELGGAEVESLIIDGMGHAFGDGVQLLNYHTTLRRFLASQLRPKG